MKVRQGMHGVSNELLLRLSRLAISNFGPHAAKLYQELVITAAAGLSLGTVILSASIVDVIQHEEAGPAGYLDGAAFAYSGSTANLSWLRGRRNHIVHHEGPSDGLMGETESDNWLASDAERAVTVLLDFLEDLKLSD